MPDQEPGTSNPVTMMVNSNQLPPIEKLNGADDWPNWKFLMELHLGMEGLDSCLAAEPTATARADPQSAEMKRDFRARGKICLMVQPHLLVHVRSAKSAFEAWSTLCNLYEDKGVHRRIALMDELLDTKHEAFDSLSAYVIHMKDIVSKIAATGKPVDDEFAAFLMLRNLKPDYKWLRQLIERSARTGTSASDTTATLSMDLVSNELIREAQKEAAESRSSVALKAGGGHFRNQTNSRGQQSKQQQTGGQEKQPTQQQQTREPCSHCNRTNHKSEKCWFKNRKKDKKGQGKESGASNDNDVSNPSGPTTWSLKLAALQAASDHESVKNLNKSVVEWYVDSGACAHMCGSKELLENYQVTNKHVIECAGDQKLFTEGKGTIKIKGPNGLEAIEGVTYVPKLSSNLLSVSSICKAGLLTLFNGNECRIFDQKDIVINGKPLLSAEEKNGTYKLSFQRDDNDIVALNARSVPDYELWHKRLAHLGKGNMELMINGFVNGIGKIPTDNLRSCNSCIRSKQTRASFPKGKAKRAKDILGIVHSDVCEVPDCFSWKGFKYFVTFIDDKTRYTMIALLKTKDEVLDKFKQYKILVEKQTGKSIKIIRSDNGGEYCSKAFQDFSVKEGIQRQFSVAGTPEQNGVAERANRTLMEKTRSLLMEAGLDLKYWGEALHTAVYLKNISPTVAVPGMVPFEAWTGTKPNVEHLKVFGCTAYVHVPQKKSKKLGDRGKECIFVGYDEERKGYKLVDPKYPRNIIVERSVIFEENTFPCLNLKTVDRSDTLREGSSLPQSTPEVIIAQFRDLDQGAGEFEDAPEEVEISTSHNSNTSGGEDSYSDTELERVSGDEVSSSSDDEQSVNQSEPSVQSVEIMDRFPKRTPKPLVREDFIYYKALMASNGGLDLPISAENALKGPDSINWKKAMQDELDSFAENSVWTLVEVPDNANIVGNKWVFKKKLNMNGAVLYRARLVAKGYSQTYGVDYFETFAPVVQRTTLRALFSAAVSLDLKVCHFDVKTAFLNGDLDERVYMAQPEGFVIKGAENKVCLLSKAVYGLKQSARSWNQKAHSVLQKLGFKNFSDEPCVYVRKRI